LWKGYIFTIIQREDSIMKGLVWGPTFEIADAKLNDIK
jgi:hypothetical protein